MKEFTYVITDEIGIHARPAGLLVKEAKNFTSNRERREECTGTETDGSYELRS